MPIRHPGGATGAGLLAIGLWATFPLVSGFARAIPPMQLLAMGYAVAALALFAVLMLQGRLSELRQPPLAWLHGVGGIFGFNVLIFAATRLAPAPQVWALDYTWPLLTVLFTAGLMKRRLRVAHVAGMALGFAGCTILALKGDQAGFSLRYWTGYACALGAAVFWAAYSALSPKLARVPSGALAAFYAATAALAGLIHLIKEHAVWPGPHAALAVVLLGLGPMGMAYFFWDYGVKRGDPILLGSLSYLAPALSYLLLALPGYAPLGWPSLAAITLVVAGGLIAAREKITSV